MMQDAPLNILKKKAEWKLQRVRSCLQFYEDSRDRIEQNCLQRTNQLMGHIGVICSHNQGSHQEFSNDLAAMIAGTMEHMRTLVGLYQEEGDAISQFRSHLRQRQDSAFQFQKKIAKEGSQVKMKSEIKQQKNQSKSISQLGQREQGQLEPVVGQINNVLRSSTRIAERISVIKAEENEEELMNNPRSRRKMDYSQ